MNTLYFHHSINWRHRVEGNWKKKTKFLMWQLPVPCLFHNAETRTLGGVRPSVAGPLFLLVSSLGLWLYVWPCCPAAEWTLDRSDASLMALGHGKESKPLKGIKIYTVSCVLSNLRFGQVPKSWGKAGLQITCSTLTLGSDVCVATRFSFLCSVV